MFTRFSTPRHRRTAPIAGTFVSLTAHAALLVAALGSEPFDARGSAHATGPRTGDPAGTLDGERLHWVGTADEPGAMLRTTQPGALPPIAYVVPGRGALRERVPGRDALRHGARRSDDVAAAVARRPDRRRWVLPLLPTLPALPDVDAALLVAGVISAAPDPSRLVSRPEDFVHTGAGETFAERVARTGVQSTDVLSATTHVDELPIALVSNPRPSYPLVLERAHVGGRVVVEFRIDSAGAIEPGSLRVVLSTNALFTQAVRTVLPRLRFLPAQLGRQAVGVTVRQPFLFTVRSGV